MIRNLLFIIIFCIPVIVFSQEFTLTGTVLSVEDQTGLPGASVLIQGTTQGTTTDIDGKFFLNIPDGSTHLVFSSVGFLSQTVAIAGQSVIDITMEVDIQQLEEIVVIGYGTVRKSDLTGSVSSVKSDDLIKIPSSSPEQALQGKMAGVQVTSNSGAPGEAPVVRIRGVGTFGNPDPIYVVDGVILDDISFLSSADIESMEVLKDASSTAMYGSRGANGVIMVTTKRGSKTGVPSVNLITEYNVQQVQKKIDVLNAREFATVINQIQPGTFNNLSLLPDVDWQDEVYRSQAPIYNAQLSVSGSGEKSNYYVGVGYFKQEGIIPKSNFEKITLKINNDYFLNDHVKIGHNIGVTMFDQQNTSNVVASTLRAYPTDEPYGGPDGFAQVRGNGNPLAAIEFTNDFREGRRIVSNFYGEVKFLRNFTFRSSFGIDYENSDSQNFTPLFFVSPQQNNDETRLNKSRFSKENWLWENTLNYHLDLTDHSIDLLAGYTSQEDNAETLGGSSANLLRDDILYLSNDQTDLLITNTASIKSLVSYLFRANYVAFDKYLFTATFRRDGSSIFASDRRWGNFPSFAVGWRVSDESFFDGIGLISNLKLRGSWGIVGNDKVQASDRFTLIQNEVGAVFGEDEVLYPGSTYGTTGNPKIKWEEARQTDIGMELGFWENKLTVELDYYRKVTEDILITLALPGHFGNGSFATTRFNAADVLNRGFEFSTSWKDQIGDFRYEISAVGSTIYNEVIKMGDTFDDNPQPMGNLGNGQNVKRVALGNPIGYFYGYKVAGIFQNEDDLAQYPRIASQGVGDFIYADVDNDGEITPDDRTFIGSPIPDLIYGFSLNGFYKNFSLSLDFQGETGREIYNGKNAVRAGQYNYESSVLNAWSGENTSNDEPRLTSGGVNYSQSDWFIQDGSFLRLRSATIGYSVPDQFLRNFKRQNFQLYVRGTNIFTLTDYTGYTPEIGGDIRMNGIDTGLYPVTSVYTVGLNLTL